MRTDSIVAGPSATDLDLLVDLPDGQTVRCRVVNVKDDGTIQVVPEHPVIVQ